MSFQNKPFKIEMHYKHDFRDWIRGEFPKIKAFRAESEPVYKELESRFDEVHSATTQVFDIIFTRSVSALQAYYAQDREKLNEAFQKRDVRAYEMHLDSFLDAIGVE